MARLNNSFEKRILISGSYHSNLLLKTNNSRLNLIFFRILTVTYDKDMYSKANSNETLLLTYFRTVTVYS